MSKLPKIAILADFPWSFLTEGAQGRGAGQGNPWLMQLAEELVHYTDRFEFHWINLDGRMSFGQRETAEWKGHYFYRLPRVKITIDLLLGYLPSKFTLLRELKRLQPDLVHCWGSERPFPIVFNSVKVKKVLSMQGIMTRYKEINAIPPGFQWHLITAFEPSFIKNADIVTCESQWGIDQVRRIRPDVETYQVEYGVNKSFYDVTRAPDNESPYALFVGSVDARKGVPELVEAMKIIQARGHSWKLRICGSGELNSVLEPIASDNVEWLGLQKWESLQRQLAGARCLVLPTKADTSPNVVKEARVIGLPVVTTKHGGQAEYVLDEVNGLIADPLSPESLADALERIMGDVDYAEKLGATKHQEDRDYFRAVNTAKGFIKVYEDALSS
jgi:glycosyltransferase involved in cell wall biosynthesis